MIAYEPRTISKHSLVCHFSDDFVIFSGGMPRASYGDRHTISVWQGGNQVVFDFTSRVIDFVVLSNTEQNGDTQAGKDGLDWKL